MTKEHRLTRTDTRMIQILLGAFEHLPFLHPVALGFIDIKPSYSIQFWGPAGLRYSGFIIRGPVSGRMMEAVCVDIIGRARMQLKVAFPNMPRCSTVAGGANEWFFQVEWIAKDYGIAPVVELVKNYRSLQ